MTVGLPIYNAEAYLAECLKSILSQSYTDFKLLAIVDGPNAACEAILGAVRDSRLEYSVNPVNLGITRTANLLLERTDTPYFARMDADDRMKINRIEVQLSYLESHPDCDILGSFFEYIDPSGKHVGFEKSWPQTHSEIRDRFRIHNPIINPTVMFRTEKIRQIGGYDESYVNAEDLALWLKALVKGLGFTNLPDNLLEYRLHDEQATRARSRFDLDYGDRAYAEFGAAIWGDHAPDFVGGRTKLHRLVRRLKRNFKSLFGNA